MPNVGIAEIVVIVATVALLILIPAALIMVVVRLLDQGRPPRSSGGSTPTPSGRDPAVDALRTRFANGDIDLAEFERLRSVLQRH